MFRGADRGSVDGRDEAVRFERSLSLADARHGDVLLAYAMNGDPLPVEHGYPVRLIVPSWYGVASVKWLTEIDVIDAPFEGYFQTDRYVYDYEDDGRAVREPVRHQRVRSVIVTPSDGQEVDAGDVVVRGLAWSGAAPIASVDVAVADGPWQPATLIGERRMHSWQWWELRTQVDGHESTTIRVRATDLAGRTQPERTSAESARLRRQRHSHDHHPASIEAGSLVRRPPLRTFSGANVHRVGASHSEERLRALKPSRRPPQCIFESTTDVVSFDLDPVAAYGARSAAPGCDSQASRRNSRTAATRLFTCFSSARSKARKMALMCFSTVARCRCNDSAIASFVLPWAINAEHVTLAVGQAVQRRRAGLRLAGHQPVDDLGVDHRTPGDDLLHGPRDRPVVVADALLEEIAEPRRAVLQQLEGVAVVGVLGQHEDADVRVPAADLVGRLDALHVVRRWHPDVGDHGVGAQLVDLLRSASGPIDGGDHLELAAELEDRADPLAVHLVVLGDHHPQRHAATVGASGSSATTIVPPVGLASTVTRPPSAAARSAMFVSPLPADDVVAEHRARCRRRGSSAGRRRPPGGPSPPLRRRA